MIHAFRTTLGVLLVGSGLLAYPGIVAGQGLEAGEWPVHARFGDEVETWTLHITSAAAGAETDLLMNAGAGVVVRLSRNGDRLRFTLPPMGAGPEWACALTSRSGDTWEGECTAAAGGGSFGIAVGPPVEADSRVYADADEVRPRARELGLEVGVFPPGEHNAITDVGGVRVGHSTVRSGGTVRTGVTAIIPAEGDLYAEPIPGWIYTANGYGKLIGETQVREFGEIETPIVLTCTLCVWSAARGLAWILMEGDSAGEHTINPVVGETNDSWLSDMWADPVGREHVQEALDNASDGPVEEGAVGAGTGTSAFGWKGGIGTSSRVLPESLGGYTVGVLVQTNFGGSLTINGAPVGRELGSYSFRAQLEAPDAPPEPAPEDGGSLMMVLATDAPLTPLTLERLAERAMFGAVRTGSFAHNSSGDYVIAFSTAPEVRRVRSQPEPRPLEALLNPQMSPLFAATVEATEEAIYNAILKATTTRGRGRVYKALPLGATVDILRAYGVLNWGDRLPPGGSP